jgi:hypothetical protein
MADATLTIPPERAEQFQREAQSLLTSNAEELRFVERRARGHHSPLESYRAVVRGARQIYSQLDSGSLRVESQREALVHIIRGCMSKAADELQEACEATSHPEFAYEVEAGERFQPWEVAVEVVEAVEITGPEFAANIRHALGEVEAWLGILQSVEEGH